MTDIILKKYPKESAAAKAVELAKMLSKAIDKDPTPYEGWVLNLINVSYDAICNASPLGQHILKKNGIENIRNNDNTEPYNAFLDAMFCISAALYYSINGNERAAWLKLVDAGWHAGFATKREEAVIQIEAAKINAVKIKAKERAEKVHANSLKTQIKNAIKEHWKAWKDLAKKDPQAAQALYKTKTSFAYDMLSKYPHLAGAKRQDPEVVMGWIRGWEKPKKD
jgi:hypothetical protein